ncbi:hypothetical protein FACS1894185_1070 [Betaproteobacteria bacterium]|nr:hypothetical protein FACS1894185_1070 [Betaproteobacteria bacterium]
MSDDQLIQFVEQLSGEVHLRVEENLGSGFVRLRSAEAERRQAKHDIRWVEDIVIELLRNARDAGAQTIFVATTRDGDERLLTVLDDGAGIPATMQQTVFEPRVTSKLDTMVMDNWGVHGRGMALYSIKANTLEARVVDSALDLGTAILVRADTKQLAEKHDQSSLPTVEKDEDGNQRAARGPHNIVRTVAEFALDNQSAGRQNIVVYFGSPAEITATLMDYGHRQLKREELLFCKDVNLLPVTQRLAASGDALDLEAMAAKIGLGISERTAHRILAGQIEPLRPLLKRILYGNAAGGAAGNAGNASSVGVDGVGAALSKDIRGLKVSKDDLDVFSRSMEEAFEQLAERYYLSLSDLPKVSIKGDTITVKFHIEKD